MKAFHVIIYTPLGKLPFYVIAESSVNAISTIRNKIGWLNAVFCREICAMEVPKITGRN